MSPARGFRLFRFLRPPCVMMSTLICGCSPPRLRRPLSPPKLRGSATAQHSAPPPSSCRPRSSLRCHFRPIAPRGSRAPGTFAPRRAQKVRWYVRDTCMHLRRVPVARIDSIHSVQPMYARFGRSDSDHEVVRWHRASKNPRTSFEVRGSSCFLSLCRVVSRYVAPLRMSSSRARLRDRGHRRLDSHRHRPRDSGRSDPSCRRGLRGRVRSRRCRH